MATLTGMDPSDAPHGERPSRTFQPGEVLVGEGQPGGTMMVILDGVVEVRKGGVAITHLSEPGTYVGEMSALLDLPYSADVVAVEPTTVLVVDDAGASMSRDPALTLQVATLLAHRLHAVTSYLADLRRQYAGQDGHLGLMDQVLTELMASRPSSVAPGSEREDVPDY